MPSKHSRTGCTPWPRRYAFAIVLVGVAILARAALTFVLGSGLPFIIFFPAILAAAFLGGVGPGIVATVLSAVAGTCLFMQPAQSFATTHGRQVVGFIVLLVDGAVIIGLADLLRRRDTRLQDSEKVVDESEKMIVVVDRDHRYVIANRAFLNYRGMSREQVIGRTAYEIL